MSELKTVKIEVKDLFNELREENNRLLDQLLFQQKLIKLLENYRICLNSYHNNCKCDQNIENKLIFNDLENQYKCFSEENANEFVNNEKLIDQNLITKTINFNTIQNANKLSVNEKLNVNLIKIDVILNDHNNHNNNSDEQLFHTNEDQLDADRDDVNSNDDHFNYTNNVANECNLNSVEEQITPKIDGYFWCKYTNCDFKCDERAKVKKHIIRLHVKRKPIVCEECEQIFWKPSRLVEHLKQNHSESYDPINDKFKCNYSDCSFVCTRFKYLVAHKSRLHSGINPYKCDYELCESSFVTFNKLRHHKKVAHSSQHTNNKSNNGNLITKSILNRTNDSVVKAFVDKNSEIINEISNKDNHSKNESNQELLDTNEDNISHSVNKTCNESECNSNSIEEQITPKIDGYYWCKYTNCNFKCDERAKVKKHIIRLHIKKDPITCEECEQIFWKPKTLTEHMRQNHSQSFDTVTNKFKCNFKDCSFKSERFDIMMAHKKRHSGIKSFHCDYQLCEWSFFTSNELRNHKKLAHSSEKPYVCDWDGCDAKFKRNRYLVIHKFTHTGNMPFKCEWPGCEMGFGIKQSLEIHRSSHIGLKQFSCDWPECGQKFRSKGNLRYHYSVHTNEKPFCCEWPGCESRFRLNAQLKRHKLVHRVGADFHCFWPQCGKQFRSKPSLKLHLMSHNGEKPFKCEATNCDMKFVDRRQMRKHFKRRHIPK